MWHQYFDFLWCLQKSLKSLLTTITVCFFKKSVNRKQQGQYPFLLTPHVVRWTQREVGPRKDFSGPQIPTCRFTIQEIPQSYCLPCGAVSEQDLKYHLCSVWKLPKSHWQKPWSTERCNSHPPLEQRLKENTSIFLLLQPEILTWKQRYVNLLSKTGRERFLSKISFQPARPGGHHSNISHLLAITSSLEPWQVKCLGLVPPSGWRGSDPYSASPVVKIPFFI